MNSSITDGVVDRCWGERGSDWREGWRSRVWCWLFTRSRFLGRASLFFWVGLGTNWKGEAFLCATFTLLPELGLFHILLQFPIHFDLLFLATATLLQRAHHGTTTAVAANAWRLSIVLLLLLHYRIDRHWFLFMASHINFDLSRFDNEIVGFLRLLRRARAATAHPVNHFSALSKYLEWLKLTNLAGSFVGAQLMHLTSHASCVFDARHGDDCDSKCQGHPTGPVWCERNYSIRACDPVTCSDIPRLPRPTRSVLKIFTHVTTFSSCFLFKPRQFNYWLLTNAQWENGAEQLNSKVTATIARKRDDDGMRHDWPREFHRTNYQKNL